MRIRKDDEVMVIGGKDSGKAGRVLRTEPKKSRVYVEGLNLVKSHERPQMSEVRGKSKAGGIVEKEGAIHVSNVMLIDPKDNKPTRIGVSLDKGGKKIRVAKRSGEPI